MEDFLLYITKTTICLSVLFIIYRKFLSELAFFAWNRFFLLLALPLSLLMPLVELAIWPIDIVRTNEVAHLPDNMNQVLVFHKVPNFNNSQELNYVIMFLFGIYTIGVAFFGINLIKKIRLTISEYSNALKTPSGHRLANSPIPAWSFFNEVIINQQVDQLPEHEKQEVLQHEYTHSKQWHSADILAYEWASVLLWFNPLVPKIRQELTLLHEYLADRAVVKNGNTKNYSRLILKLSGYDTNNLASGFSNKQVATRIRKLNIREQSPLRKLRFLLAVPLIAALLAIFSLANHALFGKVNPTVFSNRTWEFPLTDQFAIIQTFIKDEQITKGNINYTVGHERITIAAKAHQDIIAIADGFVKNTWHTNNWGVNEYGISLTTQKEHIIVVDGLKKLNVKKGQHIIKGQTIGKTGDNSLFPKIKIEVWVNKKRINPLSLYQ